MGSNYVQKLSNRAARLSTDREFPILSIRNTRTWYFIWVAVTTSPGELRTRLKAGDPKIVAMHSLVTQARLLGIEVEGWI